jgi:hypothetical protein
MHGTGVMSFPRCLCEGAVIWLNYHIADRYVWTRVNAGLVLSLDCNSGIL